MRRRFSIKHRNLTRSRWLQKKNLANLIAPAAALDAPAFADLPASISLLRAPPQGCNSEFLDLGAQIIFGLAKLLLQSPEPLIFLALGEREIIIGQLTISLFQLSLHFVPTALDL